MAKQMEPPTQEQIARRAQEIYLESGSIPGRDLDNWLEAERQLTLERAESRPVTAPEAPAELLSAAARNAQGPQPQQAQGSRSARRKR